MPCDGDWGGATVGLGLQGGGWIRGSTRGVAGGSQCLLVLWLRLLAWEARCAGGLSGQVKELIWSRALIPAAVWCVAETARCQHRRSGPGEIDTAGL